MRQVRSFHRNAVRPFEPQMPSLTAGMGNSEIRNPKSEIRNSVVSLLSQKHPILLREIGGNRLDDPFSGFDRRQLGM